MTYSDTDRLDFLIAATQREEHVFYHEPDSQPEEECWQVAHWYWTEASDVPCLTAREAIDKAMDTHRLALAKEQTRLDAVYARMRESPTRPLPEGRETNEGLE